MNFHHHPPLVLPELVQHNGPTGRVYSVRSGAHQGQSYPSITRILGDKPKPGITAWRARVGADEAQRITQQSAARGTALHTISEMYLANEAAEYDRVLTNATLPVRELWQKLSPWLNTHITGVYAQECSLYSDKLKVAGRTDLVADVDGELAIVDFKNARKPKRKEYVQDYFLQGTFYACALYELTGLRAKRLIFPVVSPDAFQVFETTPMAHFATLKNRIDEFYLTHHAVL